jgi:homoserine kinase
MRWPDSAVRVRVPATSANLGPGYDALGLALGLHDEIEVRVGRGGLSLDVAGEGADEVAGMAEKHLVVRAMRAAFDDLGREQPGLALRCVNRIPHGRGLGSSAAAIVAGILAARALSGADTGPDAVLPLASELEGHPDNVAPCLYGGLTIAWIADGTAKALRLEPLPGLRPVAVIAPAPVSTEVARDLLPARVPHADAASNAGRAALLVAALTAGPDVLTAHPGALTASPGALTARPDVLLEATQDRLHQDYRAPAMPATQDLVRRLRAAGIPAVVSGAGPSVLAFPACDRDLETVGSTSSETGIAWLVSPLDVERQGASVIPAVPQSGDAGSWGARQSARG